MRVAFVGNFRKWVLTPDSAESINFRKAMIKSGFTCHWRRLEGTADGMETYTQELLAYVAANVSRELCK